MYISILQLPSSLITSFRNHVSCPQIQYIKPRAPVRARDADDIFDFLNSHDQELKLCHHDEIRKYSAPRETEKSEPDSDHKKRTMTVLKLPERAELIEASVNVFEDIDWNKQ
jgi:hypothetical protein